MLVRMKRTLENLRLCGDDVGGSVLPMAAAALPVIALLVGGGVDISRAYQVKSRLQYACDAGVLAGRKESSGSGEDADEDDLLDAAETAAATFFEANFDDDLENVSGTSFVASTPDEGNTVVGTASTEMDTVLMQIFGADTMELSTTCTASMAMGNSDVMMVLDVTGSMACTAAMSETQCSTYINNYGYSETAHGASSRLQDLEDAMKGFYDTVSAAQAGTNARIRFGFVPYSSAVNVGGLLNPNWLVDSMTVQSRRPVFTTVTSTNWVNPVYSEGEGYSSTDYGSWNSYGSGSYNNQTSCTNALPANVSFTDYGYATEDDDQIINSSGQRVTTVTTSQQQRNIEYQCAKSNNKWYRYRRYNFRYHYFYEITTEDPETVTNEVFQKWVYENRTYDTSQYKAGNAVTLPNGTNGTNVSYTWGGCIQERQTVNAAAFTWSNLTGMSPTGAMDLDLDLEPDTSNAATQWRPLWSGIAYYRTSNGNMTNTASTNSGSAANVYCPVASQGLEEMDEDGFYEFAESLRPTGATYHDIGMIWGGRLLSPDGIFGDLVREEPDNGGSVARHIIFMSDGQMAPNNNIYSTYGVEFHDRRVSADGSSNLSTRHNSRFAAVCEAIKAKGIRIWVIAFSTNLSTTMTNCASTDSSFTATNSSQLNSAFQDIAQEVGELRITQ